jgi:glutathione S-transferase
MRGETDAACHPAGIDQARARLVLPEHVTAKRFPRLAALAERAMKIDAFASTVPHL